MLLRLEPCGVHVESASVCWLSDVSRFSVGSAHVRVFYFSSSPCQETPEPPVKGPGNKWSHVPSPFSLSPDTAWAVSAAFVAE